MCLRKINNVDIIAHAGPVPCWVVLTENGDLLALAECDLENERDQVKLRLVVFPPSGRRSGSIKVAQGSEAYAMNPVEPVQHAFKDEFRFPVRAAGDDSL